MGEGNDFVEVLVWPPTQRLLALENGGRVLDVACGNGLTSRRMAALGQAIRGQPQAQPLFHRPLHALFRPFLEEGLVIDALEEPGFPADHPEGSTALSWGGRLHEIRPVLVARARRSV